jgi:hypothetical protein
MALRISLRECTRGRTGAFGVGKWGSMQAHSASDKSVWYALLMLGRVPSYSLKTPFRTVSEGMFSETRMQFYREPVPRVSVASARDVLFTSSLEEVFSGTLRCFDQATIGEV